MARLESVFISGIRSFGITAEDSQTIKFFSPVTLILGQNGCGKTTIIESVRHALTGDFPKGRAGQFFVADPSLYKTQSVKANIKLKFKDSRGNNTLVTRAMRLDLKKGNKMSFCSLDSSIEYITMEGERVQKTGKVVDINKIVFPLVGVPDAILSNVIFCHQEESLWPLDEPSSVKKKFDEIFDSIKYNSAVKAIMQGAKKYKQNQKDFKNDLKYLTTNRDTRERLEKHLAEKQVKLKSLTDELQTLKKQTQPLEEKRSKITTIETSILELERIKAAKEAELKSILAMTNSIKSELKEEFKGNDQELNDKISSFSNYCNEKQSELESILKEVATIEKTLETKAEVIEKKSAQLATINEQVKGLNAKIEERDQLINQQFLEFNLEAGTGSVEISIDLLKKAYNDCMTDLESKKCKFIDKERELQETYDETNNKKIKSQGELAQKIKELKCLKESKMQLQEQLNDANTSHQESSNTQQKINSLDEEIAAVQNNFNESEALIQIESNKTEISSLEKRTEILDADLRKFMENNMINNQLHFQKSEIKRKEDEVLKIKENNQELFHFVFDKIPNRNIRQAIEKKLSNTETLVQDIRSKVEQVERKLKTLDSDIRFKTSNHEQMSKEYGKIKRQLEAYDDFSTILETTSNEMKELQRKKGQLNSAAIIYRDFVKQINENHCCPICDSNISDTASRVSSKLSNQIKNIPNELKSVTERLAKIEKTYDKLQQLKPVNERFRELSKEIPNIGKTLSILKQEQIGEKQELDKLKLELVKPEQIINTCRKIASEGAIIDQLIDESEKARFKCVNIQNQLVPIHSERTQEETDVLMGKNRERVGKLRNVNDKLYEQISSNQRILENLRSKRDRYYEERSKIEKTLLSRPKLVEQLAEIDLKLPQLQVEIQEFEDEEEVLVSDCEHAKFNLNHLKQEQLNELDKIKHSLRNHEVNLREISKIHESIVDIERKNLRNAFDDILRQIAELKEQKEQLQNKKSSFSSKSDKIKDIIRNQEELHRMLLRNKKLRSCKTQEITLKKEIESLQKELGDSNYQSMRQEKMQLDSKLTKLGQQVAHINGEIASLKDDINGKIKELETEHLKNAYKNLHEKYVEHSLAEKSNADLETYAQVLETALCRFHQYSMQEVNRTIRTLWRQIYTGNDIDYIEVVTGETTVSTSRRNYSYKVVQRKGEVIMDLRGRCSAGQKVLACLIIRIALAQHFSANCGILALDEPTTNLDKENIRSLSSSLARLVSQYTDDLHIQFLIITHDEEFLTALKEVTDVECFYRVSRNLAGRSVVTPEEI